MFFNTDCITGARQHLADNSVDLIITDPPYGIAGESLHKHYNRNETTVLDGYIDVPMAEYAEFSQKWIAEAERVLRPGGSLYIVSGYTNLVDILNALRNTKLKEVNHIIWKYNFGVYTKTKYVSSHYHILFYQKLGGKATFNTHARFGDMEKDDNGGSLNYQDREDVWYIPKEYKPGQIKNKNELPTQLLVKMIQYSSNENDLVCDFFLGSFSTAKVAIGLNRRATGFEKNEISYNYQNPLMANIEIGNLLKNLRQPPENALFNQGKKLETEEINEILQQYKTYKNEGKTKKDSITLLTAKTGRGYWSLLKIIDTNAEKIENGLLFP